MMNDGMVVHNINICFYLLRFNEAKIDNFRMETDLDVWNWCEMNAHRVTILCMVKRVKSER